MELIWTKQNYDCLAKQDHFRQSFLSPREVNPFVILHKKRRDENSLLQINQRFIFFSFGPSRSLLILFDLFYHGFSRWASVNGANVQEQLGPML